VSPSTTSTYTPPTMRRPLGVAILSVLMGVYGFLTFLGGLLLIVLSSYAGSALAPIHISGTPLAVTGLILLILGLVILGTAVGLWHLRMWALVLALLVLVVEMILYGLQGAFISFEFILALILFVYLIAVSRHFS
jgi:hypothetical protein